MLKTNCLNCGLGILIDFREGEGYFFGFDTYYFGDAGEEKDPHEIIGYCCKKCGDELRAKSDAIGWKRID